MSPKDGPKGRTTSSSATASRHSAPTAMSGATRRSRNSSPSPSRAASASSAISTSRLPSGPSPSAVPARPSATTTHPNLCLKGDTTMDIVLKLRELRRHRGLSQKDVGRRSGVGEKTLSSFETGERIDTMKIGQLRALLTLYDVTEEDFFSDKLDQMFDPTYVRVSTRLDEITARITD